MGTHPIFESDFDCLTDLTMNNRRFNLDNEENQDNRNRMGFGMFFMILMALPVQYYLVNQHGGEVNVNARNMEVAHMVKGATQFVKEWMTIGAWEARIEDLNDYILQIATKIEERQYKRSKQAAKVFTAEGETPAHEVIDLMGQGHGYFGHSSEVRIRKSGVKFHVGQLFRHKKYKYYGVIVGWDQTCRAPNSWKISMLGKDHFKMSKQPFYSAYTNQGDTRYVAEENIELVSGDLQMTSRTRLADHIYQYNPAIMDYFDFYDEDSGSYIPRAAVAALYPED